MSLRNAWLKQNPATLKKGDRVRCFADPVGEQQLEGIVTVIEIISTSGELELCSVKFDGSFEDFGPNKVTRWLNPSNLIPAPIQ